MTNSSSLGSFKDLFKPTHDGASVFEIKMLKNKTLLAFLTFIFKQDD